MSTIAAEAEATATQAAATDIVRYIPVPPEEYRARFVMTPDEAGALDRQLRECMRAILTEGVDYGVIPGMGTKPSLFKPGAEKLLQWFGFGFTNERDEIERDSDGIRIGVTYKCTVFKEMPDGRKVTIATCDGYAGYDEDKFFVSAQVNEAKERANAQRYERSPNPLKFAEYRAPWNSLLKMAHKRALVGAVLDATGAASLFTQDLEDMRRDEAPDGTAFTAAAAEAIKALPARVGNELTRWYRAKSWPSPDRWTPGQWVAALIAAGEASAIAQNREARPSGAQQPASGSPASQPPAAAPEPPAIELPEGWTVDAAIAAAASAPDKKACERLWRESAAAGRARLCTGGDARRIQDILKARMEDLAHAAPALDPDDPWAVKIEGIATAAEADQVMTELLGEFKAGRMDETRANAVKAAISARAAQVADVLTGKVAALWACPSRSGSAS